MKYNDLSDLKISKIIKGQVTIDYSGVDSGRFPDNTHTFKEDLESNLYQFDLEQDQVEYCYYLHFLLGIGLEKHIKNCDKPKPCAGEEAYEKAVFIVERKLKHFIDGRSYSISYSPEDPYSQDEEIEVIKKLDEILERLSRLELGQQLTYDDLDKEIEGLKKLPPILGKRKFTELFIGSLFSWATSSGLKAETINSIYQFFTSSKNHLIP